MKLAVIKTGGKQYLVAPGQKIKIEKISGQEGEPAIFENVLLTADEGKINIGQPVVAGAKVAGKILKQDRAKKVTIFKYQAKKRHHVKRGHRQPYTLIQVDSIEE
jgi:large subunit ribosomal protein L21